MPAVQAHVGSPQDEGIELCISSDSFTGGTRDDGGTDDLPAVDFLNGAAADRLPRLLANERPQMIALVLSRLSESQAADVLGSLPDRVQVDVLRRWAQLDETDPKTLGEIERELATRIEEPLDAGRRRSSDLSRVVSVVQSADPRLKQQILNNIARYDAALVEHVASPPLGFGDLVNSSDSDLAAALSVADPHTIVLALAGATECFVERTARLLPASEAKRLRRAIESLGPTRLTDIEAAQRELARVAGMTTRTLHRLAGPG